MNHKKSSKEKEELPFLLTVLQILEKAGIELHLDTQVQGGIESGLQRTKQVEAAANLDLSRTKHFKPV